MNGPRVRKTPPTERSCFFKRQDILRALLRVCKQITSTCGTGALACAFLLKRRGFVPYPHSRGRLCHIFSQALSGPFLLLASLFVLLTSSFAASADVCYVDKDNSSGPWDGLSWESAFTTIQQGINVAYGALGRKCESEGKGEAKGEGEGEGGGQMIHSADCNGDNCIDLAELLRVIQFYNSDGLHCEAGTEDGYAPGPGDTSCTPHASDCNGHNWHISLSELLRLCQFFYSGGYHACPDADPPTEDGFCPGGGGEPEGEVTGELDLCLTLLHRIPLGGYAPGENLDVEIEVTSECVENIRALAVREQLPQGWTFEHVSGPWIPGLWPNQGDAGTLDFVSWGANPSFPATFTYRVNVPGNEEGDQIIRGEVFFRKSGVQLQSATVLTPVPERDISSPVITRLGDGTVTVECGDSYTDAGATAWDEVDGDLTSAIITNNPVNTSVADTYTITYNVSDAAGNPAAEVTRTVTVEDTTGPVITLNGPASVSVQCGTEYPDAGASALDACDGDVTGLIVRDNPVDTWVPDTYTVTYNVSDGAGNAGVPVTRTVTVENCPGDVFVAPPPEGNDTTGDGSAGAPWATIGFAMNRVSGYAGPSQPVTIHLATGVYDEPVVFVSYVSIAGAGSDFTGIAYYNAGDSEHIVVDAAESTAIRDCTITLPGSVAAVTVLLRIVDVSMQVSNVVLDAQDNLFSIAAQIAEAGASQTVIEDCVIRRVQFGIQATNTAAIITRNLFEDIRGDAIFVRPPETKDATGETPRLGDETDARTGFNSFDNVDGFFVKSQSATLTKAELNYHGEGFITEESIATKMSDNVDFVPFLGKWTIPGTVVGTLLNQNTGEPIPLDSNPVLRAGLAQTFPDTQGQFIFPNLDPGSMTIQAEAGGFIPEQQFVTVGAGAIVEVNFLLEAAEGEGEDVPVTHSADQNGDNEISLSELLRVIQFFNSFGYHCADNPRDTEDGYVPGPGANHACTPHGSDYNTQDWDISLSELLRLIQFFNVGGYHACPGQDTEDGYCPGAAF